MKIIVDAFGGDNAPQQILLGCAQARESLGIDIVLAGDKARLEACAKELDLTQQLAKMEILPCGQLLTMEDEPTSVIREKSDSSMAVGLRALAQGQGDAFASAGNSGALVVGATTWSSGCGGKAGVLCPYHAGDERLFHAHRRRRQRGLPPGDAAAVRRDGLGLYEERHGH
ncbi:MAG: hypothetical protein ACLRWC_06915 [Acutalibacter sp.]